MNHRHFIAPPSRWALYERLKQEIASKNLPPARYAAAIREAARKAGV